MSRAGWVTSLSEEGVKENTLHIHTKCTYPYTVCVQKVLTTVAASTEQEKVERIPAVRLLATVNYKTINQNVAPN